MSPNPLDTPPQKKFKPNPESRPQDTMTSDASMSSEISETPPQNPQEPVSSTSESSVGGDDGMLLKMVGEEFGIRFEPYEFPLNCSQFEYPLQQGGSNIPNIYFEPWDNQYKSIVWPHQLAEQEYQVVSSDEMLDIGSASFLTATSELIETEASGPGFLPYRSESMPSTSEGLNFQAALDTALQNISLSIDPAKYLPNTDEVYYQPQPEGMQCNNLYGKYWTSVNGDTIWPYQPAGPDISHYPVIDPNHDLVVMGTSSTVCLTTALQTQASIPETISLGDGSELSNNVTQPLYVDTGIENMEIPLNPVEFEPSTSQVGVHPTQGSRSTYSGFWDNAYKGLVWPFQSTSQELPAYPISPGPSESCSGDYAFPDMVAQIESLSPMQKAKHSESDEELFEDVDVLHTFDDTTQNADIDIVTLTESTKEEQPVFMDSLGSSKNTRQESIFLECRAHRIESVPACNSATKSNNEPPPSPAPVCQCQYADLTRTFEHSAEIAMEPVTMVPAPTSTSIQHPENITARKITFTTSLNLQLRKPQPKD